jgi:hypothetical protein
MRMIVTTTFGEKVVNILGASTIHEGMITFNCECEKEEFKVKVERRKWLDIHKIGMISEVDYAFKVAVSSLLMKKEENKPLEVLPIEDDGN